VARDHFTHISSGRVLYNIAMLILIFILVVLLSFNSFFSSDNVR
jgi:hypothetical protein